MISQKGERVVKGYVRHRDVNVRESCLIGTQMSCIGQRQYQGTRCNGPEGKSYYSGSVSKACSRRNKKFPIKLRITKFYYLFLLF